VPPPSTASRQQAAQLGLLVLLRNDLARVWSFLNIKRLDASLPAYVHSVAGIVQPYGQASAALAAQYYQQERFIARPGARHFTVAPANPVSDRDVDRGIRWATKSLWDADPDIAVAQTMVESAADKMVLDPGRDTLLAAVKEDREAKGWARIPDAHPCYFCALLATRGAAYKSEFMAEFEAHPGCQCLVQAVFDDEYRKPARVRKWDELYKTATAGTQGKESIKAFRAAYEGREYIPTVRPVAR
jgi:hypothetical protein